ncbi:Rv3654c family TadE-like protein [Dactylosporangium sp. CA-233914]|uniref:Rv3654c family TadE-like protein n=1 Tax=Dactylosporangium sp. CA-233914 TaxID=3239934 RepID=UPI003D90FAF2
MGRRMTSLERERGSASIICLAVGVALMLMALGFLAGGGVIVARHRARNAADAGALAGAMAVVGGARAACAAAGRLAEENDARLVSCAVAGPIVTVTVEVVARTGLAARAEARAGPVEAGN